MADRGTWAVSVGGADLATYADILEPLENDGGVQVQQVRLWRGTGLINRARGNLELAVAFSLTKEFATNKLAGEFWMSAPKDWNGVADVVIKHKSHDGSESTWTIAGAAVRVKAKPPIGVSVIASVSITGGSLVLT